MRYYVEVLCLSAAAVAALAFAILLVMLAGSALSSAVQGDWTRAAAHAIGLMVAGMMVNLLVSFIADNL